MRTRKRKPTDDQQTEKAYKMLENLVNKHPEIEMTLWYGALMSAFVNGHVNTGCPYETFCDILDDVKEHYKQWFNHI